ncbi:putative ORFX [Streptomyces sp. Tu6071]|nr:putative ORFX [Streptomyces sp. Tu6071]
MRAGSLPGDAARSAALYTEVQAFYARQAHHLDAVRAEEFAATFAAEGVFAHSPDTPAARGRAAIAEEVRGFNARRFADDPVQRRHWFSMLGRAPGCGRRRRDGVLRAGRGDPGDRPPGGTARGRCGRGGARWGARTAGRDGTRPRPPRGRTG